MNEVLTLGPLQLLRPWWLLALLALPLLAWLWWRWQQHRNAWRGQVDAHLLPHLLADDGQVARLPWLALFALALLVLALSGPSWSRTSLPLWQAQAPLVVAIDLSEPMLANDLPPSRLLQARAKLATLLRERAGGQVGLVAYAGDAYTVAPLTDDVANIALFLDALAPDVMPDFGADLAHGDAGRAIVHARRLLQRAGFGQGEILLLTAGADAGARNEAAAAAGAGYRVSVLGLGSSTGGSYPRMTGTDGSTRLQGDELGALANAGSGHYIAARIGDADLRSLGVLDTSRAEATQSGQGGERMVAVDQGWLLVLPALLLVLLLFRRGAGLGLVLMVLLLPMAPLPSQAQSNGQAAAGPANEGSLWRRADQQAHAQQRDGEAAYRRGDYPAAARAFAADASPRGQYNLGNALAKQGRYDEAIAAYDRALAAQPQMRDAQENRRIVEAARRQQQSSGRSRQQQSENRQREDAGQGQQGEQDGQQSGQRPDAQGAPEQRRDQPQQQQPQPGQQQGSEQEPQAVDAQAQAEADAQQRARMQQALQQAENGTGEADAQALEAETAQEREQRLINEAQLRRIQDDPGGLLRAKFRLERQRRLEGRQP